MRFRNGTGPNSAAVVLRKPATLAPGGLKGELWGKKRRTTWKKGKVASIPGIRTDRPHGQLARENAEANAILGMIISKLAQSPTGGVTLLLKKGRGNWKNRGKRGTGREESPKRTGNLHEPTRGMGGALNRKLKHTSTISQKGASTAVVHNEDSEAEGGEIRLAPENWEKRTTH